MWFMLSDWALVVLNGWIWHQTLKPLHSKLMKKIQCMLNPDKSFTLMLIVRCLFRRLFELGDLCCTTSFSSFLQFLSRVHQKYTLNPFSSECIKPVPYQADFLSLTFGICVVMQAPQWPHTQLGMDQMEPFRQSTGRLWLRREVLYEWNVC